MATSDEGEDTSSKVINVNVEIHENNEEAATTTDEENNDNKEESTEVEDTPDEDAPATVAEAAAIVTEDQNTDSIIEAISTEISENFRFIDEELKIVSKEEEEQDDDRFVYSDT